MRYINSHYVVVLFRQAWDHKSCNRIKLSAGTVSQCENICENQ